MGISALRYKNTYGVRCDRCKRPAKIIYKIKIGDFLYSFDSGICAQAASKEYQDKMNRGITPSNLEPLEEESEGIEFND